MILSGLNEVTTGIFKIEENISFLIIYITVRKMPQDIATLTIIIHFQRESKNWLDCNKKYVLSFFSVAGIVIGSADAEMSKRDKTYVKNSRGTWSINM